MNSTSFTIKTAKEHFKEVNHYWNYPRKREWVQLNSTVVVLNTETIHSRKPYSMYFIADSSFCYEWDYNRRDILKIHISHSPSSNKRIPYSEFFSILVDNNIDITEYLFSENGCIRDGAQKVINKKG